VILNKASKLGLYALTEMARNPRNLVSASSLADRFELSENHIAKVLQQLARSGLLESVRGAAGGYQLSRPATKITMADVVTSLEGPAPSDGCAECPLRTVGAACTDRATCHVHGVLAELTTHVHHKLRSVTIDTLARGQAIKKDPRRSRTESA
jgi:Rrf2 family protein